MKAHIRPAFYTDVEREKLWLHEHAGLEVAQRSFAPRSGLKPASPFFHPPIFEKMNCSNSSDPRLSSQPQPA